ncbi:MAG: amidohydrolase family protein, partial [Deltaproteobacteria bacterium]|nr:amidohydrolase family protein [Deltaproteobacteria bacterium]
WRQALDAGSVLAFGSDFPVEPPDPRLGLWAATARTPNGTHTPWMPEQALSLEETLRAFTWGAAFAERREQRRGLIRAGHDADLTIFATDPAALAPEALRTIDVIGSVVAGHFAQTP